MTTVAAVAVRRLPRKVLLEPEVLDGIMLEFRVELDAARRGWRLRLEDAVAWVLRRPVAYELHAMVADDPVAPLRGVVLRSELVRRVG